MAPQKQPLVIIPSSLVLGRTYQPLVKKLSYRFKTYVLELPGSGGESGRWKTWNEEDYAQWLIHQLEKRNIHKPILFGHSNSGNVVLKVAHTNSKKIKAIILSDITGTEEQSYFKVLIGRVVDTFIEWKFSSYTIFHFLYNILFHPLNFFYQIRISVKSDQSDEIKNINIPTLIAWGERDHTVPIDIGKDIKKLIPHAEFVRSPDGSHDWCVTHQDDFIDVVVSFYKSLRNQ